MRCWMYKAVESSALLVSVSHPSRTRRGRRAAPLQADFLTQRHFLIIKFLIWPWEPDWGIQLLGCMERLCQNARVAGTDEEGTAALTILHHPQFSPTAWYNTASSLHSCCTCKKHWRGY